MKMDIYKPARPRSDKTCVIYVFGGGFINGQRDNKHSVQACDSLVAHGFTAISIDYRLGVTKERYDSLGFFRVNSMFSNAINMAVEDLSSAIAYVWEHADQLDIDRNRIVLTGASAGAITVLQNDYCRCNSLPQAKDLPKEFKPLAVIPYSGAIYCKNSQLRYATPPAPTCFFHGSKDKIVNYKRFRSALSSSLNGSSKMAKVFKQNRYPYWIFRYEGNGHEVNGFLPYTLNEFVSFVEKGARSTTCFDCTCKDSKLPPNEWSNMTIFQLYTR